MQQRLDKILMENFMPFAVHVITNRAIPEIDGFKKVQRRVLYTMKKLGGIDSTLIKSQNVIGKCMSIHPFGDSSIYDAMVKMVDVNESLTVPYIKGASNFGKVYSDNMPPAADRYTKSTLSPICEYIFKGLDEDGVDIIPNYDGSTTEPKLLPVSFPTVLINSTDGIAVGMSQSIPNYSLSGACNAIIGLIDGTIQTPEQFSEVIGLPQFSMNCVLNSSKEDLLKIITTGKGTVQLSGNYEVDGNSIKIYSLPASVTIERFIQDVQKKAKTHFSEIKTVKDLTGKNGFLIEVTAKRGTNMDMLLKKLLRFTSLSSKSSFRTTVIIDGTPKTLSVMELAQEWISFREKTVQRIYKFRHKKASERVGLLGIWNKISEKASVEEVAERIAKCKTDVEAEEYLRETFEATDEQLGYFLNLKLLTKEREQKERKKLRDAEEAMRVYWELSENLQEIRENIADELSEIVETYGKHYKSKTEQGESLDFLRDTKEVMKDDSKYFISISNNFSYRKARTEVSVGMGSDVTSRTLRVSGTELIYMIFEKEIYLEEVANLPDTKGSEKDFRAALGVSEYGKGKLLAVYLKSEIEVTGLNFIYSDGTLIHLPIEMLTPRKISNGDLYDSRGLMRVNNLSKFFAITSKKRARYCDIQFRRRLMPGKKFKMKFGRYMSNETLFGIQPEELVPDISLVDVEKYSEGLVPITDKLW